MTEKVHKPAGRMRIVIVLALVLLVPLALVVRAFDLQVTDKQFLQAQGDARALRTIPLAAHRGMILDRNGEPLAVSTPVDTIWADPQQFAVSPQQLTQLSRLLDLKPAKIREAVKKQKQKNREFVFLKRRINPSLAEKVMELNIPGISSRREYRRYYPTSEVSGHVLGFTNIDDAGQEGVELAFDEWLKGIDGSQVVVKDRLGRVIKSLSMIKRPQPGKNLTLSLDRRLQYLTYRELKRAVFRNRAKSGSAVILDVQTGEILAMANQPAFNPNNRGDYKGYRYRNRVITDSYEPGSTIKPFTILAALESGKYSVKSFVDTTPGLFKVGHNTIRDNRNYGRINLATIIQKSSNVGASKIALSIRPDSLTEMHQRVGFGSLTQCGLPGEVTGSLHQPRVWRDIERATLSYGYGLSTNTLQLARAYMVLATDGMLKPVTIQRQPAYVAGERVAQAKYVRQVRKMLEGVITTEGTGIKASVPGYHVAGKTGTAKKLGKNGYSDDKYVATFVGMAPAHHPRLVMAITIHEPRGDHFYGGEVAAPVFSNVMAGALRLLDVPPDDIKPQQVNFAMLGGAK